MRLQVDDLCVGYRKADGSVEQVVHEVSFALHAGQILGLVGETGCGKSTTALAGIGYRGRGAVILGGSSLLGEADLLQMRRDSLRSVWGRDVAYISQNAATALNPALTVGTQLDQPLRRHLRLRSSELMVRKLEVLGDVGIPNPVSALRRYPHQFSGGQQQRISLAIALACRPSVLVLDEPTTGLDVRTQRRISALLRSVITDSGVAVLYVSHDLALLSTLAERVAVMYAGEIIEQGATEDVVARPLHPYTRALLEAVPSVRAVKRVSGIPGEPPVRVVLDRCPYAPRCALAAPQCLAAHPSLVATHPGRVVRCVRVGEVLPAASAVPVRIEVAVRTSSATAPLLRVDSLSCLYQVRRELVTVVRSVSFEVAEGETLGVVGLSGSGKSTMLRALVGLHSRVSGTVLLRGQHLARSARRRPRRVRRDMQIIFQDPGSSLNPRHSVEDIIRRPLQLFRDDIAPRQRSAEVARLLEDVKLPRLLASRFPWELSGGQQQRVAIARAFATAPSLLLCDEVTSSLDVSVQAAILGLIQDLAADRNAAVVFVSHDLAVIRTVADRALVMLDGEIVEEAPTEELFTRPSHPYTAELLSVVPDVEDLRVDLPPGAPSR